MNAYRHEKVGGGKKHKLLSMQYSVHLRAMILLQILLILLIQTAGSAPNALPGCPDSCGNVSIPYPFGIGSSCSMEGFELSCTKTNDEKFTPYLFNLEISNISVSLGQARVTSPISSQCYNTTTNQPDPHTWYVNFGHYPFWFNHEKNRFVAIGCNTLAYVNLANDQNFFLGGCVLGCTNLKSLTNGSCSGIGCCQTTIPKGTNHIYVWFDQNFNSSEVYNFSRCSYAVLMENEGFEFETSYITTDQLYGQNRTAVIDWAVGNTTCEIAETNKTSYACKSSNSYCLNSDNGPGYLCNCSDGYEGNPYLEEGCQDIDECANPNSCSRPGKCHNFEGGYRCSCPFGWQSNHDNTCKHNMALFIGAGAGVVILAFIGLCTYVALEKRKLSKIKQKYFQQHGGWILLEKIKTNQGFGFTIFTKQEVEQATNNFDNANIIGHGGQGTVYKGTLRDQMVAIKRCKIIDEGKKKEFGKEMLILSQINHKNIVKLLGCCIEVEVPMLIYEFIPNDTLFHYLHYKNQGSQISLETRLRIAKESAEALAYLHTSASPPIFHGDVKSANILLDQNYTAKVSDFGASILAPTDEAQFVTIVQETCGYLDPEYMQTCQLTDKSDVYSFGVVLLELLTRKPVIDFNAPEEERGLSSRFFSAMKEKKMHELLDDQIKTAEDMELLQEVVMLAKECLHMKGEDRPTMKEVAEELERVLKLKQHPWGQCHPEETETLLGEASHEIVSEQTAYFSLETKAVSSMAVGR